MAHFTIAGLVTKSAFSKPATRRYPFVKREPYANTRGSIVIDIDKCTMCTLCQKRCPTEAIEVKRTEKVWSIDRLRCIQCGACVDACPKSCLTMNNQYSPAAFTRSIDAFRQEATPAAAAEAPKA
jgi:ech hydrogenase subunit F